MNEIRDFLSSTFEKISLEKLITSVVLLVVLIVLSRVISSVAGRMVRKARVTEGLKRFIVSIVKYIMYFISILIFCDSLGLPITSLLAVFSLLGLAVSLSVQNLLSNLISGFCVLMMRPFDIGDFIETDIAGTVRNVGLFYTEILTPDNKKVFIPNEKIMANRLINYNDEGTRRLDFTFNAGYEYDTELVKETLKKAVASSDHILKTPEPVIGIAEYGESAVIYSVWVWVNSADYFTAKFEIMDKVGVLYKENGIKMAYNRLEVDIIK